MSGQLVSWRDYAGLDGFAGQASMDELQALRKALVAGSDRDPVAAAPGVGFPLRPESLDSTLKSVTFRAEHFRFWRLLPKRPAYNTVEEFNQVQSFGQSSLGGFIAEGGLPEVSDAQYERKFAYVKFLGTTRIVSHVMSMVRPAHGNVLTQETVAGTMKLLENVERSSWFGRSTLDSVQWDGIEKWIEDGATAYHIIDMRGRPLTEDALTDASLTIMDAPSYGIPTHIFVNPKNKADLVKTFFPRARFDQFQKTDEGLVGADIRGITTPAGDIQIVPSVFLDDGQGEPAAAAGLTAVGDVTKRPASPTITTAITSPVDALSKFATDDAGTYAYKVVAVNQYGRSAPVVVTAGAAVAAGDRATFGVTPGAGPAVSYYVVYRSAKNGAAGTERVILRVANGAGAGEQTVNDYNDELPGTYRAFMMQMNMDNLAFLQLAPMMKIPLATIDSSVRWMQLLYGTPVVYTPRHNVIFKNIGRATDYVGAP